MKRTSEAFRIRQGQHNNRSPPYVGFDFVLICKCNIFVIVEFVYAQVNEIQEYVQDSLKTTTITRRFISLRNYILNGSTNVQKAG